jgi:molecular chaperone Hsp33
MTHVSKFHSQDLFLRAVAMISTDVVKDIAKVQSMGPLATLTVGRAVTGAMLLASRLRDQQMIGVHFKGDGALGSVYAEASYEGEARGWCDLPQAELPLKNGHFDIQGGVGEGMMFVTQSMPFEKSPHVSNLNITSGLVGDDIAYYLQQSLQIPCVVALGAVTDDRGHLQQAAGIIIELMPGAPESVIAKLEESVSKAKPLSGLIKAGVKPVEILKNFTGDVVFLESKHEYPYQFKCRCSMDRCERSLALVGKESVQELIDAGQNIEMRCEFCKQSYNVTMPQLRRLFSEMDQLN